MPSAPTVKWIPPAEDRVDVPWMPPVEDRVVPTKSAVEENASTPEKKERTIKDVVTSKEYLAALATLGPLAPLAFPETRKGMKSLALRGGMGTAGAIAGSPGGPLGIIAGAGLGGSLGATLDQETDPGYDANQPGLGLKKGDIIASGVVNMIPGAGAIKTGVFPVIKEVAKQSSGGVLAKNIETVMDEGRMATAKEDALASTSGIFPLASRLAKGKINSPLTDYEKLHSLETQNLRSIREGGVRDEAGNVTQRVVVDPGAIKNNDSPAIKTMAGTAAMGQEASARNTGPLQALGREDLGLGAKALPITKAELKDVREKAAEPYEKIRQIQSQAKDQLAKLEREALTDTTSHGAAIQRDSAEFNRMAKTLRIQAAADVDALRKQREISKIAWAKKEAGSPDGYAEWRASKDIENSMEDGIYDAAALSGDESLLERLVSSRAKIAQSYSYENALNEANGFIDASKLASQLDAGAKLSGNALKIANFAKIARKDAVEFSRAGDPNSNAATGIIGAATAVASPKTGFLAMGIPMVRGAARRHLLSDAFQDAMLSQKKQIPADTSLANISRNILAQAALQDQN